MVAVDDCSVQSDAACAVRRECLTARALDELRPARRFVFSTLLRAPALERVSVASNRARSRTRRRSCWRTHLHAGGCTTCTTANVRAPRYNPLGPAHLCGLCTPVALTVLHLLLSEAIDACRLLLTCSCILPVCAGRASRPMRDQRATFAYRGKPSPHHDHLRSLSCCSWKPPMPAACS